MKRIILLSILLLSMVWQVKAQNGATFHNGSSSVANFQVKCAATGYDSGKRTLAAGASAIIYDFYGPRTYTVECYGSGTTLLWTTSFDAPAPPYVTSCATVEVGMQAPPPKWKFDVDLTNNTDFPQKIDLDWNGDGVPEKSWTLAPHETLPVSLTFDTKPSSLNFTRTQYGPDGEPINKSLASYGPSSPLWYPDTSTSPGSAPVNRDPEVPAYDPNANPNITFPDTTDLAKESTLRTGFNAERSTLAQGFQAMIDAMANWGSKLSAFSSLAPTAEHIDSLAGQIKANTDSIKDSTASTAANTATIKDQLGTANTKLDGLGNKLDGIGTSTANTANNTATANTKLDSIGSKIDQSNVDLEALKTKADTANTTLTGIKSAIETGNNEAVNNMSASLGGKLDGVNTKLQVVADNTGTAKDTLAQILTSGTASKEQLTAINAYLTAHPWLNASDLETLRLAEVATKDQAHTDHQATQDKMDTLATAANQQSQINKQDLANEKLDTLKNEVSNQGQRSYDQLATANGSLEQIKQNQGGIGTTLNQVKLNSDYIPGISSGVGTISGHTSHLPGIHSDTTAIKDQLPDLADNVKKIEGHTRNLTNQFDTFLKWTNKVGTVEESQGMAAAPSADAQGKFTANGQAMASGTTTGTSTGDVGWVVTLAGMEVNMNPFASQWFGGLVAFMRKLATWMIGMWAVWRIYGWLQEVYAVVLQVQPATSASAVPGFNWVFSKGIAVAVGAVLVALPMICFALISNELISASKINPFEGWGGVVGTGIWMIDQVFPITFYLSTVIYLFVLRNTTWGVMFGKTIILKFLS